MNFQNMRYFSVVAEEKNITRAAERLGLSQQALSNHIARLEEELGCKLMERRQPLELTYSGRLFLESLSKILDIEKQMTAAIQDVNNNVRGELRIGISYTRGQAILPLLLPAFSRDYPQVELYVLEGSTEELEEALQKGNIDVMIGFVPSSVDNVVYMPLMTENLYLVIPNALLEEYYGEEAEKHFQAYEETKNIKALEEVPFVLLKKGDRIRTIVDKEFDRTGMKAKIKLETSNTQTAYALASEGMGIAICPEFFLRNKYLISGTSDSYTRSKVKLAPFFEGEEKDTVAISYIKDRYMSNVASDFIKRSIALLGTVR